MFFNPKSKIANLKYYCLLFVPLSILHAPLSIFPQSAASSSFKITTQSAEIGASATSPVCHGVGSANFIAVVTVGRLAGGAKTTASFQAREGYIPTLQTGPGGLPPGPPVITTPDKKTNDTTPILAGTAEPGATVRVFEGASVLGTGTALPDGSWLIHTSVALPDGPHEITARASNANGESPACNSVVITVDTVPPAAPTGLRVQGFDSGADLFWQPNTEPDLRGYNIYRKDVGMLDYPTTPLNAMPVVGTQYRDGNLTNGDRYCYKITAVDDAANEKH
jgi:hypothetical protein